MESELKCVIDALPALVWTARPDGHIDFLNHRWCEYTGVPVEDSYGHAWQSAIHPDDLPVILEQWGFAIASGQPREAEARLRRFDGEYRWFLFRTCPITDASGQVVRWCGMNWDVEDRKRAEFLLASITVERAQGAAALERSEARKAAILDSALDCILTIDHEGCITEFNPAAERVFGYRRDQVLGRHLSEVIIPPSLRDQHRRGFARYLATAEARVLGKRIEMPAMRADGSEFPVELAITRIPLDGPPSFTGYLRDITERKHSEEELRRSAAYLAEAQRLSLTGSFGWIVSTDKHFWSAETFRIFEYDPSTEVTIQLVLDRAHEQDVHLVRQAMALAAEGWDFDYECRFVMPSGSVKHLHIVTHCTRDQAGELEYVGAVQDITERRRSEEALGKARSELARVARVSSLGALTASIAHEVNQPLTGIITNASTCLRMLSSDPPNVEGACETVRRTIRDGHRASDVIGRLRAMFTSKEMTIEPVDLNEATREVIALSRSELHRNRVTLKTEFADDVPYVTGDRIQLQQVILNLLLNASDAMLSVDSRPRQVVIGTQRDADDCVRLMVRDSGVGLEPQGVDKVFEAFYTTKSGGMGIGLSVSRSIIERHRGRLWAAANDGPGATFAFSIPCEHERRTGDCNVDAVRTSSATNAPQVMRNL